jgi:phosphoglycolate phosphatase-like HAD superfamily hydrolase
VKDIVRELVQVKKYIVFDFDGVILDTVKIKTQAFAQLYGAFGPAIVSKVVAHHEANGGLSRFRKFKYYHHEYLHRHLSNAEIDSMSNQFSDLVLGKILAAKEINGVFEFIESEITNGKTCAINSATPQAELMSIVRQRNLAKYFRLILGSPLTKAENLEKIREKFKCDFSDMIFFGDAVSDYEAARQTGIEFVGVGGQESILRNSNYDCTLISDFKDI